MPPPVVIPNPWAGQIDPATLDELRGKSLLLAQAVFESIREDRPKVQEKLAPRNWETYKEVVFVACCRAQVMDAGKEISLDRLQEHLRIVQDSIQNAVIERAMRGIPDPNAKGGH